MLHIVFYTLLSSKFYHFCFFFVVDKPKRQYSYYANTDNVDGPNCFFVLLHKIKRLIRVAHNF